MYRTTLRFWTTCPVCVMVTGMLAIVGCVPAPAAWSPKSPPLSTRWTAQVDPDSVLPEYPRPQLIRAEWLNLNGLWSSRRPRRARLRR